MNSAVASAEAVATGTLNATQEQIEVFSNAISDGISVAEKALKQKQKDMKFLLDDQLGKADAAAKKAITGAEAAVHTQISNLQSKLDDTKSQLDQGVDKLAGYATGQLKGVQATVNKFSGMVESGLASVKNEMLKTCDEVKDTLLRSINTAQQLAHGTIDRAKAAASKQLDNALVVVFRKSENIKNKIKGSIQLIQETVQGSVDKGFDFVVGTLTTTLSEVRGTLKKVAAYMRSKVEQAFATFRNAISSVRGLIAKAHGNVRMPRMSLTDIFENYVCKPLQESIVKLAEKAESSMRDRQAKAEGIESRNRVAPTSARRLLSDGASPTRTNAVEEFQGVSHQRQMLADALHTWWQQQSSLSSHVDAMELIARHAQVQRALSELQDELHSSYKHTEKLSWHSTLEMHLGITSDAQKRLELLRLGWGLTTEDSPGVSEPFPDGQADSTERRIEV